jgi:UPF0755 protein
MNKRTIVFSLIFIFLSVIFLMAVFLPKNYDAEKIFTINKGDGSKEVAQNLEKEGLVSSSLAFRIYVLISGDSKKIKAGTYLLASSMSWREMADKFVKGDVAKEKITFPEGYTAEKIYQKLAVITKVKLDDLQEHEGYLFPDTYEIFYGAGSQDIIKIMTDNFEEKTVGLEAEIKKQGKTLKDIVTMASILEKEVKTKEDKELAAGLLWKRMRAGMPLQVDAAPVTYERKGLPDSPICNPGLDSILAAVYPKASQYWYYLSTPEGKIIFSRTFDEHNIARAKYLK